MFSSVESNPALASPSLGPVKDLLRKVGDLTAGEDALYVRPAAGRFPEISARSSSCTVQKSRES